MKEGWLELVLPEGGAEIRQVVVGTPTFGPCVHCCVTLSKTRDMKTISKQIKQPSKFGGLGVPSGVRWVKAPTLDFGLVTISGS